MRIAQRFNQPLNLLLQEAHWPAVNDPEAEAREAVTAQIMASLSQMPLPRLQAMPALVRTLGELP